MTTMTLGVEAFVTQAQADRARRLEMPDRLREALEVQAKAARAAREAEDALRMEEVVLAPLAEGSNAEARKVALAKLCSESPEWKLARRELEVATHALEDAKLEVSYLEEQAKALSHACNVSAAILNTLGGRD
jgi:hypothetical protein